MAAEADDLIRQIRATFQMPQGEAELERRLRQILEMMRAGEPPEHLKGSLFRRGKMEFRAK